MLPRALVFALMGSTFMTMRPVLRAQETPESPEQVTEEFLAAIRDTNWVAAAGLMHPNALAQFHMLFRPLLDCAGPALDQARQQILGVTSQAQAARLSDTVLVAAILRLAMNEQQGLTGILQTAKLHIIGHVAEGRDTVHVLARLTFQIDSVPISAVDVFSFQRYHSTWRALLKGDFSSLGVMLRRACEASS